MTTASARLHRLTNWIGFLLFAGWACVTLSKMPAAGLFMAPTLLFEICVAVSFLIRDEPRATTTSIRARVSAYGGSFVVIAFMQIAQLRPEWLTPHVTAFTPVAIAMWFSGSMWIAYSVWHLRHAFSIEPAARRLVTSGPYAVARHPVYTGYFVQYIGMLITFPTLPFALVLLVWAALMVDRMYLEERVLQGAFPEYGDYKARVGALGPVLRRTPRTPRTVGV